MTDKPLLLRLCLRTGAAASCAGLGLSALFDLRPAGFLWLMCAVALWPRTEDS